jgi:hypothetical protein
MSTTAIPFLFPSHVTFPNTIPGQIGELVYPPRILQFSDGRSIMTVKERRYRIMQDVNGRMYHLRIR